MRTLFICLLLMGCNASNPVEIPHDDILQISANAEWWSDKNTPYVRTWLLLNRNIWIFPCGSYEATICIRTPDRPIAQYVRDYDLVSISKVATDEELPEKVREWRNKFKVYSLEMGLGRK